MVDSHCHLNDKRLMDNINEVVENFSAIGVEKVVNIGTDIETSILAREQAKAFDNVYYSVGFYPEYCDRYNEKEFEEFLLTCLEKDNQDVYNSNNKILNYSLDITSGIKDSESVNPLNLTKSQYQNEAVYDKNNRNKLLAIGEIGLDYHRGKENKDKQIEMFESQIKLAKKYNLPIIIHNRDASGDILEVLKRNAPFEKGGIIHCFSASLEWAREVIKLGFYISFSGTVTFKNAVNIQEVAKLIPEDKLLVETDSPYLAPVPHRGEVNQPMYVVDVAKFIASLRNCTYEHIDKCTTVNFSRLFDV